MRHVQARSRDLLVQVVQDEIKSSREVAAGLVKLGAVYHRKGVSSQGAIRSLDPTVIVDSGDYIRVHPTPRRYECTSIIWDECVVYEDDDLVVLDKPSAIPSCPTVDNFNENVLRSFMIASKLPEAFLPHRLDTDTSGLLMIAKNKKTCSLLNRMLAQKTTVVKHYRALLATEEDAMGATPLRENQYLVHHMLQSSRSPKIFSHQPYSPPDGGRTQECISRVINLTRPKYKTVEEWRALVATQGGSPTNNIIIRSALDAWFINQRNDSGITFQECTLELITGKTHQARGQLSNLGSGCHSSYHIAGDNNYTGCTSLPSSKIDGYRSSPYLALQSARLSLPYRDKTLTLSIPKPFWAPLLE